jgi:2-oxo-4-hydroxy-4-carboxy-5-ureidoimidazoline decarboxylase
MTAGRPHAGRAAALAAADAATRALSWEDVLVALEAHPRIGERAAGVSREARWSPPTGPTRRSSGTSS